MSAAADRSPAGEPDESDESVQDVAAVADRFLYLMRSFARVRSRLLAAAAHDVEWSAHILLKCLANDGPMRSSALAERIESDPSTVSRQVATLVQRGLLERHADPEDGRACLLVPTAKAHAVLSEHNELRVEHFRRMLQGWSSRDLNTFASLLQRFSENYDNTNHDDWFADRIGSRRASAGGNT